MEIGNRPWGKYEVLYDGDDCKVKRITVNPGEQLSVQYHKHREEHWTIIHGNPEILLGEQVLPNEQWIRLLPGSTITIHQGKIHSIRALSKQVVFIEVQRGDYFGEDDIVRISDIYGRTDED